MYIKGFLLLLLTIIIVIIQPNK